jgi:methyl-accepting chemotaxis protein
MSEDHNIAERLTFIGLDEEARASLRAMKPLIDREVPKALDTFYKHVRAFPETRKHFSDEAHMNSAKSRQASHWSVIASAEYGDSYVRGVRAIGRAHARLGLDPRWYIGGYAVVADEIARAVVREYWKGGGRRKGEDAGDAIGSLIKAVLLDMDFSISIYIETLEDARRKQEAERAEAEERQAALVRVLATALDQLSAGNLAFRITDEVASDYEKVKQDFNAALTKLQESMRSIAQNTHGIESGTDEIAQAADDLSRRTEQQAASLEETAAALDQITATVRKTASGAKTASEVVLLARSEAEKGGDVVTRAVDAMSAIEKSSSQIAQIIGVIDEIAFQTNLLALNAGVEAARAGDAGRGFAVVAQEVRALAQRSADAAKEIKALISASSTQVGVGVKLVDETGASLRGLVGKVLEINNVVSEIAASAQEQSTALAQVNTAVNQMDQATQQNAAMVEQSTAATHSLKGETAELARLIGAFQIGDVRRANVDMSPAQRRPQSTAFGMRKPSRGGAALAVAEKSQADSWEEF